MGINKIPRSLIAIFMCLPMWAWAQPQATPWFDGQGIQTAWVDASSGVVALSETGQARHLNAAFTVVTSAGQAQVVMSALQTLGLTATTRLVPDRVYVHVAADRVLATTLQLQGLAGVEQVRLQWASRIAVPQAPR